VFDNLTSLEYVDVSYNEIVGNIPNGFGGLEQLEQVYLQHNLFTGLLPESLGNCSNMISMDLSDNAIASTIPSAYGKLAQLTFLNLSYNNLVGQVPVEFANLTSLTSLQLSSNNLSGALPPCATLLQDINLSSNRFDSGVHLLAQGDVYNNLINLDVSNNKLGGQVATFLSQLERCPNLRHLNFGNNLLVGPMRFDFGMFPYLKYLAASNNNMSGHIPSSFAKIECGLELVDVSHNQITGVIPAHINSSHLSELRVLKLSNNNLQGPIPPWVAALKTLQVLDLSHNNLTGSIPSNIDELDNFKVRSSVRGTSTDLTDEPFCTLTQGLELNKGGPVPISYTYVLATLVYFDLSSNRLNGSVSPAFAQLVGLEYLNLSQNMFQGEIPQEIGNNLTSLEFLDVSSNNLTGTIPSSLANIHDLQFLNVSLNNLSGEIPTSGQFNTFGNASYLPGNYHLCGDVVNKMHPWCVIQPSNASESSTHPKRFFGDEASLVGFFIGMALGASLAVSTIAVWIPTDDFALRPKQKHPRRQSRYYGLWRARA
jgi:Leucine-rich repeat (LRR) protein